MKPTLALLTAILLATLASLLADSKTQTVSETALRWQRPAGAPRHSDVSFSIRWMRKDVDPFEKIAAFHGTRFDWIYATKAFIAIDLRWTCDERQTMLEIPALNPWALLIVSPAKQEKS